MDARQINSIGRNFNFGNRFVVDRKGMGGGLALFWNSDVIVNIKSHSSHHINTVVQNDNDRLWRCMGIYGHLESNKKHHIFFLKG